MLKMINIMGNKIETNINILDGIYYSWILTLGKKYQRVQFKTVFNNAIPLQAVQEENIIFPNTIDHYVDFDNDVLTLALCYLLVECSIH